MKEKHKGFVGGHQFMAIQRPGARIPYFYSNEDIKLFWWGWFVRALGAMTHQRMLTA
jgi:hypothetical protein